MDDRFVIAFGAFFLLQVDCFDEVGLGGAVEEDGFWFRFVFGYILVQFLLLFLLFWFDVVDCYA